MAVMARSRRRSTLFVLSKKKKTVTFILTLMVSLILKCLRVLLPSSSVSSALSTPSLGEKCAHLEIDLSLVDKSAFNFYING